MKEDTAASRFNFSGYSVEQLIETFNDDVGHNGWVSSRAEFLAKLHDAFLATGLDCSAFISRGSMSMARPIRRDGSKLVPIKRGRCG